MPAQDLNEHYTKLTENLSLPVQEVNEIAQILLSAPDNDFLTTKMRVEAIVMHPNHSREIYELVVQSFIPDIFEAEDTNILHMLLSHPTATEADLQILRDRAEHSNALEWFVNTVNKTIELNDYQLGLSYNGVSLFQDRSLREQLIQTNLLLDGFKVIS